MLLVSFYVMDEFIKKEKMQLFVGGCGLVQLLSKTIYRALIEITVLTVTHTSYY